MSQSLRERNAERFRAGIEAWNRGDDAAVAALLDPEIETRVGPGLVNSGTFHGLQGFSEMIAIWTEAWGSIANHVVAIETPDDAHVVAEVNQVATGAASGVPVEMVVYYLFEVRDGRAVRFHLYAGREQALAAVDENAQ